MKLKKIISMGLCVIILSSLTACKELPNEPVGGDATEEDSNGDYTSEEIVPEEGAVIKFQSGDHEFAKEVAELFEEKYSEYGVEVLTQESGVYDFNKSMLEGATGEGADVFMQPHDKTIEGLQAGLYLEIAPSIVDRLNEELNEVAMNTVTIDGKVYGVPVSIETNVMFYNKELVKDEPASSFEELMEGARKFNNPTENKFWFLSDVSSGSPIYPMLSAYGFELFGEDGRDEDNPGFDAAEFEKGLEVLADYKNLMPIASGDLANVDFLTNQFVEGKTAYLIGGPWNVQTFRDAGVDFGVTKLIAYDGQQQHPFAFVQNAHVSSFTQYPKASMLFAEFLVCLESARLLHEKAEKITTLRDLENIEGLKNDEILLSIADAFNDAEPMPSAKRISYYWTIASSVGPAVFDGQITPAEGAIKAQEDWNAFIEQE